MLQRTINEYLKKKKKTKQKKKNKEPQHDNEENCHRTMTGIGMGTDNNTRQQKWQQHMTRETTRTGEEWKVQAMDPAPYNEECKKGPRDINISWAVGKFFLFHFIFLSLTKFLVINY